MTIRNRFRIALQTSIALLGLAGVASAQGWPAPARLPERVVRREPSREAGRDLIADLSGPRFGVTVLGGSIRTTLRNEHQIDVSPIITQFGWQLERQFGGDGQTYTGITELVALIGGTEQNQLLPSLSWLVGFRDSRGYEVAVGPNVTPIGSAVAFVGGLTRRVGSLNVPVNVAIVPSRDGVRVSLLSGFNLSR